nr:ComEC/Rec2 family competence protein [Cellulomonas sp. APG4]
MRTVAPAAAAWLVAGLVLGASARWTYVTAALAAVSALVLLARAWRWGGAPVVGLVLATTAVVLTSYAVQAGPRDAVDADVRAGAVATLTGVVRSEPVLVTPRPGRAVQVRFELVVEGLEARGRAAVGPLRVVVLAPVVEGARGADGDRGPGTGPGGDGVEPPEAPAWGSRVRVSGRLVPTDAADRAAALVVAHVVVVEKAPQGANARVHRLRSALLAATEHLTPDARGLVPGAAIGDTRRLPADLAEDMRVTGLTHITAVSGGHFSVIAVVTLGLTALLRWPAPLRAVVTAAVMGGFVLLVHPEPSVLRAAVMGGVTTFALVLGRPARSVAALGTAVVVLLVCDPWLSREYGFVLSVLATAAIVLLAPALVRRVEGTVPRAGALAVAVPAAAQLVCAPVLVLLEPALLTYAVPANLLAGPALVPATVLGVAATLVAPWAPGVAAVVAWCASWATAWIALVARGLAGLPGASVPWPEGAGGAVLLGSATAVLLAGVLAPRGGRAARTARVGACVVALCLVLLPLRGAVAGRPVAGWDVVACDVGQGDALVVRSGPSSAVLVDTGPDDSVGRCLDALGVRTLDLLVLTHPHADHVGGLRAAVAGRQVRQVVVSPVAVDGNGAADVAALRASGVPVAVGLATGADASTVGDPGGPAGRLPVLGAGRAGDVGWEVLGPPSARVPAASSGDVNDASVVVLLDLGDVRVLALGDLEPPAQERLLAALTARGRATPAEIVKVAHHGSARQSAALAEWLSPRVALVSAGADNDYGHPSPQAVDLYARVGALVLSTHECGDVVLAADPAGLAVHASCPAGS